MSDAPGWRSVIHVSASPEVLSRWSSWQTACATWDVLGASILDESETSLVLNVHALPLEQVREWARTPGLRVSWVAVGGPLTDPRYDLGEFVDGVETIRCSGSAPQALAFMFPLEGVL